MDIIEFLIQVVLLVVGVSILLGVIMIAYMLIVGAIELFKVVLPYLIAFGVFLIVLVSLIVFIDSLLPENKESSSFLRHFNIFEKETVDLNTEESEVDSVLYIQDFVSSYGHEMVDAINTGDFSLVIHYLYPEGPLYLSQKKLVKNLYSRQITETVVEYRVDDVRIESNEWVEVDTYEEIDVHRPEGTKATAYTWTYKLKWNEGEKNFQLYSID